MSAELIRPEKAASQSKELETAIGDIVEIGHNFGLDFYPIHFELVPARIMYEFGGYGIPGRFSHWTHGKAYHQLKTLYDYGLSKIYELVINTNPARAFLLENNKPIQNKLVAAHVLGHVDFFKNNPAFAGTNRQMSESTHLRALRIREYEQEHGRLEVEKFLDAVLSIQLQTDPHGKAKPTPDEYREENKKDFESEKRREARGSGSPYNDLWKLDERLEPKTEKPDTDKDNKVPLPAKEEADILWVIANFSPKPLEDWQRDIIEIVRDESLYFFPQMQTRIMNEGWASYWHVQIMRELGAKGKLRPEEEVEWIRMHAGVLTPGAQSLNPYYLGFHIWMAIEHKSKGLPYPDIAGGEEKNWWGLPISPEVFRGKPSYDIFDVRSKTLGDQTFIGNYLSEPLIRHLEVYTHTKKEGTRVIESKDPQTVKEELIKGLTNCGVPVLNVGVGGIDYRGNRELYLLHKWEGLDLDIDWAGKTLRAIYTLWGRPVHLETIVDGERILLTCRVDQGIERTRLAS